MSRTTTTRLLTTLKLTTRTIKSSSMSTGNSKHHGASYHLETTGEAAKTVAAHSGDQEIVLFGACFCPFVHRVWIAFEHLSLPYHYYEVDPYKKPADLVQVSPKGLVPGLRLTGRLAPKGQDAVGISESTVILDFIEDLHSARQGKPGLLPSVEEPYKRAVARSLGDRVNRSLVPSFYRYLQAQEPKKQVEEGQAFKAEVAGLVQALPEGQGPFALGGELGWVDAMVAPWLFRSHNVLAHYRGYSPPTDRRYVEWTEAIFAHPSFKATTSTDELYLDSYSRYAENRPGTSQVADAINSGRPLP